jgi:hypothetical protein
VFCVCVSVSGDCGDLVLCAVKLVGAVNFDLLRSDGRSMASTATPTAPMRANFGSSEDRRGRTARKKRDPALPKSRNKGGYKGHV